MLNNSKLTYGNVQQIKIKQLRRLTISKNLFQCACKWAFKNQHKLKQAAKSCSLKVKEALGVDDRAYEQVETDSEYTFRVSNKQIKSIDQLL